jgi:transposase-like protein
MKKPVTLQQAIVYFGDSERAFEYAKFLRWPDDKVTCPRCGSDSNSFVKTRKLWFCNGCKKQFTVKVGTIFEDSPIGLDKWMTAVWMICACKNGISSYELHRALGVTQKTAWFMLHRIREAMKSGSFMRMGQEGGPVEADETFVGGKPKNMHLRQRKLAKNGNFHTQGIENFWSLLKRGLSGTYVAVEPYHLDRYVAEQVFRFNNRATKDNPLTDEDRFALAMSQIVGRRLTYAELTGRGAD